MPLEPMPSHGPPVDPMLEAADLVTGYGKRPVLHGVSFSVGAGQVAVFLGLNGAGKTTLCRTVCGAMAPWSGELRFEGADVSGWSLHEAVGSGVVMVPEGRRVFGGLSVERNLTVGGWSQRGDRPWLAERCEEVYDSFPALRDRAHKLARTLSGGEQQMLAIGRGLMARPRVLIVDEASLGLAPIAVEGVFAFIEQIAAQGVTVLLAEQNVGALDIADVAFVVEQGTIAARLSGAELCDRTEVERAFIG